MSNLLYLEIINPVFFEHIPILLDDVGRWQLSHFKFGLGVWMRESIEWVSQRCPFGFRHHLTNWLIQLPRNVQTDIMLKISRIILFFFHNCSLNISIIARFFIFHLSLDISISSRITVDFWDYACIIIIVLLYLACLFGISVQTRICRTSFSLAIDFMNLLVFNCNSVQEFEVIHVLH